MTKIEELERKLNECQKALAELKESKKEGKWKPEKGEEYWHRDDIGGICWTMWDSCEIDIWRYKNIPIFPTQEACEKYWHFMDTVKEKSYEFSREEWKEEIIKKWFINYDYCSKRFYTDNFLGTKTLGTTYFATCENAQYIIDNFKEELLKYWL